MVHTLCASSTRSARDRATARRAHSTPHQLPPPPLGHCPVCLFLPQVQEAPIRIHPAPFSKQPCTVAHTDYPAEALTKAQNQSVMTTPRPDACALVRKHCFGGEVPEFFAAAAAAAIEGDDALTVEEIGDGNLNYVWRVLHSRPCMHLVLPCLPACHLPVCRPSLFLLLVAC